MADKIKDFLKETGIELLAEIPYDDKNNTLVWHSNAESKQAEHGVGIQAAQLIALLNADVVMTGGNFGLRLPKF